MAFQIPVPTPGQLYTHCGPWKIREDVWTPRNITCIVNLMGMPMDWPPDFEHIIFEIRDYGVPEDAAAAPVLLKSLCDKLAAGINMAVHCHGGHGRTGMVVALLYAKLHGVPGAEAIEEVRKVNARYIETEEQEKYVRDFVHE